jgi:4-hydroxy-tetrahydrodipicolinate reductase
VLRVAVHGAGGRLGRLVVAELDAAPDLVYAGAVPREGPLPGAEVVIDVSSAAGTAALLPRLDAQALVVGTTGVLPWGALEERARTAPVAVVPNFSVGVPLLDALLRQALPALPPGWEVEIVEAHHRHKQDAPSGTARKLAQAVEDSGRKSPPTHSLRAGDTVGEHTVWLCGPGERIELRHVATRREVFALGALRWARHVATQGPGLLRG